MFSGQKQAAGFTIVELLIVIIVIAILAAITIVSYNGITKNAALSSVKADFSNTFKKLEAHIGTQGAYPTNADSSLEGAGIKLNKSLYAAGSDPNYLYCVRASTGRVAIVAQAKDGTIYAQTNTTALAPYTNNPISDYNAICNDILGASSPRYAYTVADGWRAWAGN